MHVAVHSSGISILVQNLVSKVAGLREREAFFTSCSSQKHVLQLFALSGAQYCTFGTILIGEARFQKFLLSKNSRSTRLGDKAEFIYCHLRKILYLALVAILQDLLSWAIEGSILRGLEDLLYTLKLLLPVVKTVIFLHSWYLW